MAVHMISHNAPTHRRIQINQKKQNQKGRGPSFYGHVCMMYETFRGSNIWDHIPYLQKTIPSQLDSKHLISMAVCMAVRDNRTRKQL